jgi:hypothetical protein
VSKKIAPALRALFDEAPHDTHMPEYAPARAELRAMLGVVRAAERLRHADVNDLITEDAVWRALDRLARVSKGER